MLIHNVRDFSPYTGVMLPRVYRKQLLHDAFSAIPRNRPILTLSHPAPAPEVQNRVDKMTYALTAGEARLIVANI